MARLTVAARHLRPGGIIGGPAMFLLANVSAHCAMLSRIGWRPLAATANAGLDVLWKPTAGRDLLCEATILKFGKALVVVEARLCSEGDATLMARAHLTCSIPPQDCIREV